MHPHIARAAEKVEVVKQLLAPGPNGMPVAMAAMMGQATGPAPPPPPGMSAVSASVVHSSVVMVNGVVVQAGGAPPMMGGPMGGGPMGGPVSPWNAAYGLQQAQQAQRAGKVALYVGLGVAVVTVLLTVAGIVLALLF